MPKCSENRHSIHIQTNSVMIRLLFLELYISNQFLIVIAKKTEEILEKGGKYPEDENLKNIS